MGPRIVRDGLPATQAINVEDDAMRLFQEIEEDVDDAVHGELNECVCLPRPLRRGRES